MQDTATAEVSFTFRVDRRLKEAFMAAAKQHNRNCSLLLRDFMASYAATGKAAAIVGAAPSDADEVNFGFRVSSTLKENFRTAARSNNRNGSLLLRDFMATYAAETGVAHER